MLAVFFLAALDEGGGGIERRGHFARMTTETAFLAVGAPELLLALVSLVLPDPVRGLSREWTFAAQAARASGSEPRRLHRFDGQFVLYVFGLWHHVFVVCARRFGLLVADLPDGGKEVDGGPDRVGCSLLPGRGDSGNGRWGMPGRPVREVQPASPFHAAQPGNDRRDPVHAGGDLRAECSWIFGGLFFAVGAMYMNIVPCYSIVASVVMPNMRAVACGAALASIHLLGDIWSPNLMGWAVETFGQADSMATIFGKALTVVGAVPVAEPGHDPENLTAGMLVVIPALLISGIVLLSGAPSATGDGDKRIKLKATDRFATVNRGTGLRT